MRPLLPFFALLILPVGCFPAERIDNVLAKLVPADSQSLFGARMDLLKSTPLYTKLVTGQKLESLDSFVTETGFDPRRDVRELLVADRQQVRLQRAPRPGRFSFRAAERHKRDPIPRLCFGSDQER